MNSLVEQPPLPDFIYGEEAETQKEPFRVDDERKAAWACSRILAARRRIARRRELAEVYQTRILDWLTKANDPDESSAAFLEATLRPWVEETLATVGRSRSIRLPGAKVGFRKKPDRVELLDQDQILAFCREHQLEGIEVIKTEVSKTELKRHLVEGAQIPGAELVTGNDELTVSAD
jgi:hypothetical protein